MPDSLIVTTDQTQITVHKEADSCDIDTRPVAVTFFRDEFAKKLDAKDMLLPDLRDLILKETASTKDQLPWLKLATFGDKRTAKGSLRHDDNVNSISGVELDYDGEVMAFDDAAAHVRNARLQALVYTSPSHTVTEPRWRILLPTSCDLPPEGRAKLVARVNGVFRGVFAAESFTLSQSYYYGSVDNNPAHRAEYTTGDYIDLRPDLDAGSLGKREKAKADCKEPHATGFEAHLARMGDGDGLDGFNGPLCSATAAYALQHGGGLDRDALKTLLRGAIVRAPKGPERDVSRYLSDAYLDTTIASAIEKFGDKALEGVSLNDFYAYMVMHKYIFAPSREMWPASSVNARLGSVPLLHRDGTPVLDEDGEQKEIPASTWLDQNKPVEQMTWAPGLPMVVPDRLISEGGWIERDGVACFNLYGPPIIEFGNAAEADRWLDHVHKVFGDDDEHIVNWLSHRVQRPQDKINHALVIGGNQGIGKDTMLEPAKHAVGPWNFTEVSPHHMLGRFNGFLKSVILRVSEARDLGDVNRFQFYDHMKSYTAAPPDVLRVDEKNLREHSILNCCGVIITTNHKADGIYLPADDRRHYVAWSDLTKGDFTDDYWNNLWGWYANGGICHVAALLAEHDLSGFDAKAPPPKTAAFWAIVDANRAPEDAELADVLDKLGNPDGTTIAGITLKACGAFFDWIIDRKNRRVIPHRLESCGYVPVRNDAAKDGLWKIKGVRQVIYVKADLSVNDRLRVASALTQ
jgi:hypothetical protein